MKRFGVMLLVLVALGLSGGFESNETQAAGKGMVKIVTTPGDAKIFINGKRKGNSPSEAGQTFAIKLPEGEYVVKVVKPAGKHYEYHGTKTVFVAEDTLQTVSLKLKKQFTKLGKKREAAKKKALAAKISAVLKKLDAGMVKIPGGTFRMGCVSGKNCSSDEKPVHRVTVSGFYMGKYEVTFDQWDACFADGGCTHYPSDKGWGRGKRPVINVSWNDARQFIKWLSQKTGQKWRLPTEAEWEYAARGGTKTAYSFGNRFSNSKANIDKGKTVEVGNYPANNFGLHDMHGNVSEWCSNWYGDYKSGSRTDPLGPNSGSERVYRGGDWWHIAGWLRSAKRNAYLPRARQDFLGFRLVRQP